MKENSIKLFCCDMDGTLTDGTVYYSTVGEELKQFNMRDGMGFQIIKENTKCKVVLITNEIGGINQARADKLLQLGVIDDFIMSKNKLTSIIEYALIKNIALNEIAYIGDDINDIELLKSAEICACPIDAHALVLAISGIYICAKGGHGAVRDFIDLLHKNNYFWKG